WRRRRTQARRRSGCARGFSPAASAAEGLRAWARKEAGGKAAAPGGVVQHRHGRGTAGPELADAGVAARLAQLLARRLADQRMVGKERRLRTTEHAAQADLAAGGLEQVLAAD